MEKYSLVAFAKQFGKPKTTNPRQYTNSLTGEPFVSWQLVFLHPTEKDEKGQPKPTYVKFSSKLGRLTAQQIGQRYLGLQIVKNDKGDWVLCDCGRASWEDVNFPIE